MEPQSPEQPKNQEPSKTGETIIPRHVAKAFGRAMRQILKEDLKNLRHLRKELKKQPDNGKSEDGIIKGITKFDKLVDAFTQSEKVKLTPLAEDYDFSFSKKNDSNPDIPVPDVVLVDGDLLTKLLSAFNHRFRTNLTMPLGFSEIIAQIGKTEAKKEIATQIKMTSESILRVIDGLRNRSSIDKLAIVKNAQGERDIIPIHTGTPHHES